MCRGSMRDRAIETHSFERCFCTLSLVAEEVCATERLKPFCLESSKKSSLMVAEEVCATERLKHTRMYFYPAHISVAEEVCATERLKLYFFWREIHCLISWQRKYARPSD